MSVFKFCLLFLSATILINIGCDHRCTSIRKLYQKRLNPTFYTFNATVNQVKKAMFNIERKKEYLDFGILDNEKFGGFYPQIYNKKENINDYILEASTVTDYHSNIYYNNSEGFLLFFFQYQIHIESIDSTKTKIEILPFEAEVVYAYSFNIHNFDFSAYNTCVVRPTTIEEYKLLLAIGKELGEKGMPQLILPEAREDSLFDCGEFFKYRRMKKEIVYP